MSTDQGSVRCAIEGRIARITFDRPRARNAMTWAMYEQLAQSCERIAATPEVRVAVLRGAGGQAFVAGTDIGQFRAFVSGEDGVEYERKVERYVAGVESLPVPTIAVTDGWTIGGGLLLAAVCDLRIATPAARFGAPIARTLGNCLSTANLARLAAVFGVARVKRILLLAENIDAEAALACGFVSEIVAPEALDARVEALCERILGHAPVTLRVTREALRRIVTAGVPDGEDLVRECYGSDDFHAGVDAFVAKRPAEWRGQ